MTSFEIYLLTLMDSLNDLALAFLFLSVITIGACIGIYGIGKSDASSGEKEEYTKKYKSLKDKIACSCGIVFIVSVLIKAFLPSTKELAAIIFIPQFYNSIVDNKQIAALPNNVAQLVNEWIKELSLNKENKK